MPIDFIPFYGFPIGLVSQTCKYHYLKQYTLFVTKSLRICLQSRFISMLFIFRKWAHVSMPKHIIYFFIIVLVSVHSYLFILFFLCVFQQLTALAFLWNPLSSTELRVIYNQLTLIIRNCKGLTKLIHYQMLWRYDSVFTPTDI